MIGESMIRRLHKANSVNVDSRSWKSLSNSLTTTARTDRRWSEGTGFGHELFKVHYSPGFLLQRDLWKNLISSRQFALDSRKEKLYEATNDCLKLGNYFLERIYDQQSGQVPKQDREESIKQRRKDSTRLSKPDPEQCSHGPFEVRSRSKSFTPVRDAMCDCTRLVLASMATWGQLISISVDEIYSLHPPEPPSMTNNQRSRQLDCEDDESADIGVVLFSIWR